MYLVIFYTSKFIPPQNANRSKERGCGVSVSRRRSESSIGSDPQPPGQVWVISPGGGDDNPGLYQVNVSEGPGSGVKMLNQPTPPPLKESVRCAEQNLYARSKELVGDRDPRQHEFSVQ